MTKKWICSKCSKDAYYDGRCGDGPVLMCGCDKIVDPKHVYYDGRCGDGPINMDPNRARPIPKYN